LPNQKFEAVVTSAGLVKRLKHEFLGHRFAGDCSEDKLECLAHWGDPGEGLDHPVCLTIDQVTSTTRHQVENKEPGHD